MPRPIYEIRYSTDANGKITFLNELSEFADDCSLRTYTLFCVPFETFVLNIDRYNLAFIELYCIRNKLSRDQITAIVESVDDKIHSAMEKEFYLDAVNRYRTEDIFFYDQMIAKFSNPITVLMLQVRKLGYIIANSTSADAVKHCKEAAETFEYEAMERILQFCVASNHVCCVKYIREELDRIYDSDVHVRTLVGYPVFFWVSSITAFVRLDNEATSDIRLSNGVVSINAKRASQELIKFFI